LLACPPKADLQTVREYHGSYYLPQNICLIVCGHLDPIKLLEKLESDVEPRIAKHQQNQGPRPQGWKRPWVESASAEKHGAPLMDASSSDQIEFPEADESVGEWQRVYRGVPYTSFFDSYALDILCTYLTDSAVAPLTKELVEVAEPFCTDLGYWSTEHLTSTFTFYASSVPTEHLTGFADRFQGVLEKVAQQGIDMRRIQTLIDKAELKLLDDIEKNAGSTLNMAVLTDFLFGREDGKDLEEGLKDLQFYAQLRQWGPQQWVDLLKSWVFIETFCWDGLTIASTDTLLKHLPSQSLESHQAHWPKRRSKSSKRT
jgi:Zn-dependent M16 (insulinase) family peptidase